MSALLRTGVTDPCFATEVDGTVWSCETDGWCLIARRGTGAPVLDAVKTERRRLVLLEAMAMPAIVVDVADLVAFAGRPELPTKASCNECAGTGHPCGDSRCECSRCECDRCEDGIRTKYPKARYCRIGGLQFNANLVAVALAHAGVTAGAVLAGAHRSEANNGVALVVRTEDVVVYVMGTTASDDALLPSFEFGGAS